MLKAFFNRLSNSLKYRIILSAILMVLLILPIVAFVIVNAYQKHMSESLKNELVAYSYSILAVAEFENNQLYMPESLTDNQFNTSESGLYAFINHKHNSDEILWRSPSLLSLLLPTEFDVPEVGNSLFYIKEIEANAHFVYSFSVSFSENETSHSFTLHIIKEQSEFLNLMSEFRQQLWLGLLMLMGILLVLQFVWLKWSLKPLIFLKKEISDIEQGKALALKQQYPEELLPVTEQLNTLLVTEQNQRKRYRNALSDLAHSLKTPLAVLQGQITNEDIAQCQQQVNEINAMIEHQLKRAQSAGQSSWHLGVEIAPCVKKLINSLNKIYHTKDILIETDIKQETIFKGDESDLLEIIGNLLDNACKAAKSTIKVSVNVVESSLHITVEDNGLGIAEEKVESILQRGTRADTYSQGHGIGLAIVRDLVESYQGELEISRSPYLKGAMFTLKFPL